MRRHIIIAAVMFLIAASGKSVHASIVLSLEDARYGVEYSARFEVNYAGSGMFNAKLSNTTDASQNPEPLVSKFAWNMVNEPILDSDFTISDVSHSLWRIGIPKNGGIKFDYLGSNTDANRLEAGDELTFKINFVSDFLDDFTNPYDIFLDSDTDFGDSLGGSGATGQAAVKFKQLGDDEKSDLLGGNWEFDQLGTIPEPASILCWSVMGGCGLLFSRKRKKKAA